MANKRGMDSLSQWREIAEGLAGAGLHEMGLLHSTGIAAHQARWKQGQINADTLMQYAHDLNALNVLTAESGLPAAFWDVQSEAMRTANVSEYAFVHTLSQPTYAPYIQFLSRCHAYTMEGRRRPQQSAVATAHHLLRESCAYVRGAYPLDMTAIRPRLTARQQAIVLWQQVVTGAGREIPYVHRDAYTHGVWGRFNVVEMAQYATQTETGADAFWGLTGFDAHFIRDATNTNQIEHMTISALAQIVLRIPCLFLDVLEDAEWMLHKGTYQASQGDKALNRAVARHFCRLFDVDNPQPACDSLECVLSSPR